MPEARTRVFTEPVSELTTNRLSVYLRCLSGLDAAGVRTISSQALAEQFPATLIALIDEAVAGDEDSNGSEAEDEALALVDLSAAILDDDE